jgi:hypothetical protein
MTLSKEKFFQFSNRSHGRYQLFAAAHMDTRLEKSWSGLPGNETDPA